jgi:hypothetical protein
LRSIVAEAADNRFASRKWSRRDFLAATALLLVTSGFVLWQNSQIAILWDLSYLLDTSWRIALGQVPYRDFPLVHPPLTFLIQAALMRLAGRHYELHAVYAAIVGGLGTVVAWRIILRILIDRMDGIRSTWAVSLLLAAPLTVLGVYSVYPHPIYDCDCAFAILVAIYLLQRLSSGESTSMRGPRAWAMPALTGAALVVPVFFKQNMGLPFLLAMVAEILLLLALRWIGKLRQIKSIRQPAPAILLRVLAAVAICSLAAIALLQITVGLDNYLHWTVQFAAQRRLPGFSDMLAVYEQPSFAWTLPCAGCGTILVCLPLASRFRARFLAFCLLSAPLAGSLVYLFLNDDLDERADNLLALWPMLLILAAVVALIELRKGITLSRLMPFFVLAAINGTFLSQQLWGSTYAIWPLLMILIAQMLAAIPTANCRGQKLVTALAVVAGATFLVCGGLYAAGHERMNYLQILNQSDQQNLPIYHATIPALRGMADRGPYLADLEELVRFADAEIPAQDGILLLPGEEPFFFASGRAPQFPVQIFDNTTDPYSPAELLEAARNRKIRWVVVKTRLQSTEDPLPEREKTMTLVNEEFALDKRLAGYDVYRRR